MRGFIVYPTYRIIDEKAFIYLFGKLENGESFLTMNEFKPYFFIKEKDVKKALKIKQFDYESTKLKTFDEENVVKINLVIPKDVADLRKSFEEENILTYEADIRFVYRFFVDKNIKGSLNIEGNYKKGNFVDRIYEEPKLSPIEWFPKLKIVSMDIETDKYGQEIYAISLYRDDYKKVLIRSNGKLKNAEIYGDESSMLQAFAKRIQELDPDIITGWNLVDFDLKKIEERFNHYKIPFQLGRAEWECKLRIETSFFKESKADFPGRMILDGLSILRSSFVKVEDYKLNTVASEILGDKKLIESTINKGEEIDKLFKSNKQKLVDYNLKDAELVMRILEKTNTLNLKIERSLITGMQLDRIHASIASLDSLYLRELRKKGYVGQSNAFNPKLKPIRGAYVMESKPGIYDYVIVCDFKSLYSSIIRTFNIDPLRFVQKPGKDDIIATNGVGYKRKSGILPMLIQELWEKRDAAKKKKDAIASQALKTTMNSFWGALASPNCRYYNFDMAESITGFARFIIKKTMEEVGELGYEVIYGDTDSIFIKLDVKTNEEAEKSGNKIQEEVNRFFQKHIKENYELKSFLELQFDKTYARFLMPRVRGGETGAKKRYAGLAIKEGKEKIEFTGLEFVRRDWTDLSKKFQLELLDKIFHKQEVAAFIKKFVEDLKKGKYDDLLVYKKAIRKEMEGYTKTTPPHVKAARKLKELPSNIIHYVMTTDGPEPVQILKHKPDYEHYIDKQIKPLADSVLGFYGQKFDDVLRNSTQKTLFGF